MGANAVTTVPVYTAGEVLTAADMNITNSGIPVFATTVTRDAAFGGAGEKTLAEGQFAYLEDSNTTQYYDGAAWQSVGVTPGLVLVKSQTIGSAVSSVEVTGAFSATYDSYKIIVTGGVGSAAETELSLKLGATTTGYYNNVIYTAWNTTVQAIGNSNGSAFTYIGASSTSSIHLNIELDSPFLGEHTSMSGTLTRIGIAGPVTGLQQSTTSFTAFTITPASGTLTGGTIRVYGYANS